MNLCRFIPRHWLVCHALVWLVVGWVRAEDTLIKRWPAAGGAEVVLVRTADPGAGGIRSGGNYCLRYRHPNGGEQEVYRMQALDNPDQQICLGEKRISLRFFTRYDNIIVTLDVNAEEPRLYEDVFHSTYGIDLDIGLKLLTADELVLYSGDDPACKEKLLRRNEAGRWTFQGLPYRKSLDSKVTVFSPEYQQLRVMRLPVRFGLTLGVQSSFHITSVPGLYLRLQEVHAAFTGFFRRLSTPSAVVEVGPEMQLPTPEEMKPSKLLSGIYTIDEAGFDLWSGVPRLHAPLPRFTVWDLGLPCYNTYNDHIVAELREACLSYETYSMDLLAYSAPGLDGMAFSELFIRELEKAGL